MGEGEGKSQWEGKQGRKSAESNLGLIVAQTKMREESLELHNTFIWHLFSRAESSN